MVVVVEHQSGQGGEPGDECCAAAFKGERGQCQRQRQPAQALVQETLHQQPFSGARQRAGAGAVAIGGQAACFNEAVAQGEDGQQDGEGRPEQGAKTGKQAHQWNKHKGEGAKLWQISPATAKHIRQTGHFAATIANGSSRLSSLPAQGCACSGSALSALFCEDNLDDESTTYRFSLARLRRAAAHRAGRWRAISDLERAESGHQLHRRAGAH